MWRQVRDLLKRAVQSNLLEDWTSYCDTLKAYKRDIKAAKRNSRRNLCGHLKKVGPAVKLFRTAGGQLPTILGDLMALTHPGMERPLIASLTQSLPWAVGTLFPPTQLPSV